MIKIDPLKSWTSIGAEEELAALRVLRSGILSGFLGGIPEGGQEVQALEREWEQLNGGHAVAVNSATSGILIALKAVGVGPGHKVICSPYSMSAGVACILWLGAVPVFADIGDNYCMNADDVLECGSTCAAILTTNLFGGVANGPFPPHIPVIEDNAQAPLTHKFYGDIAIDSFNVHKPIQAGEGGMCSTYSLDLANKLKNLRNHGELADDPPGLNLRPTEITAAIAREQIKKGRAIIKRRADLALRLQVGLSGLRGSKPRPFPTSSTHYVYPVRVDAAIRNQMVKGLQERGVPVRAGYGGPLYNLPAFKPYRPQAGCPNCEKIESELIILEMYAFDLNEQIIDQIINAFWDVSHDILR